MRVRRRKGQALLEFAIVVGALAMLFTGMVSVSFLARDFFYLRSAVRESIRTAVNRPDFGQAESAARLAFTNTMRANGLDPERATYTLTSAGDFGSGSIEAVASYEDTLFFRLPFMAPIITMRDRQFGQTVTFVEHTGNGTYGGPRSGR